VSLAYTPVNYSPPPKKKTGIATEIASISVSAVNSLVLPVCGTVSTSDLYLMLFSDVGTDGNESGMPENCVVAAEVTLTSLPVTNL